MPAWKIYRWYGLFAKFFFRRKFDADVIITQTGQFADELSSMFPTKRIVDVQHGVIYSTHDGYFTADGRLVEQYQFTKNREFWVYGKGYAECFFKHPENAKDLKDRVKIIGDVLGCLRTKMLSAQQDEVKRDAGNLVSMPLNDLVFNARPRNRYTETYRLDWGKQPANALSEFDEWLFYKDEFQECKEHYLSDKDDTKLNKWRVEGINCSFDNQFVTDNADIIIFAVKPNVLPVVLSEIKNIVAIKEASGNLSQVAEIAHLCGDNLNIYSGNDDQIIPILSLGGKGVISVLSNIMPKYTHDMIQINIP